MNLNEPTLRAGIAAMLQLKGAHIQPEQVFAAFTGERRGVIPNFFSHSAFQLLEHMRLALADQLEYCINPEYGQTLVWPDDYWPKNPVPKEGEWEKAVGGYNALIEKFTDLALRADLTVPVPKAEKTDHTILRGILLMCDHNAYHLGQMVLVGKATGVKFPGV
ncbi:MAG: DinB family protein [Leptospirales bacterium]|nr:DinB family protein [Leptospirales bacterium]